MKATKRTRHPELSVASYHALPVPPHLNFSTLRKYAADGPWRCYWDIIWPRLPHEKLEEALAMMLPDADEPPPVNDDDTDARRVGRLFHLAMEKDRWQDDVICLPTCLVDGAAYETMKDEHWDYSGKASLSLGAELNTRTAPHKRYLELFREQAAAEGKEFMSEADKRLVFSQVEACLANQAVQDLVSGCTGREVAHTAETDIGITMKALVDVEIGGRAILDYKTTRFNTPQEFVRDAIRKGYGYQGSWYLRTTAAQEFYWVAVTKRIPAEAMAYQMPPDLVTEADQENEKIAESFAMAATLDSWHSPGFATTMFLTTEGLPY